MIDLYDKEEFPAALVHKRAQKGLMAAFLNKTMPPDPKPAFVWPQIITAASRTHFRLRKMVLISLSLVAVTIGLVTLLLQIPFLDQSVVRLLTQGFEMFIPQGWAIGAAWATGLICTSFLGSLINHDRIQKNLMTLPATKFKFYNFILILALQEEQIFRSGSETWSWPQKVRASLLFGIIHVVNIWYSLAAGIALGITGFGFLLVHLWYYRKTKNQVIATAASATVHALYNMVVFVLLVIVLVVALATIIIS